MCLIRPVLSVKPSPRRPPKVRRLSPGSILDLKKKGQATLFLGREAQCNLKANGGRTTVQTRSPMRTSCSP